MPYERLGKLKRVGFWRSEREPFLPDPKTFVDESWDASERQGVIAYLESSYYMPVAQGGPSWCRFGCSPRPTDIGTQDLTDGTWLFPEGLVHYLRSHAVKPPAEFLEHIRRSDYRVPELSVLQKSAEQIDAANGPQAGRRSAWVVGGHTFFSTTTKPTTERALL